MKWQAGWRGSAPRPTPPRPTRTDSTHSNGPSGNAPALMWRLHCTRRRHVFLFMHFCCVVRFGLAPLCGWNLLHPNVPSGPFFFFSAAVNVSKRLNLANVRSAASYDTSVCTVVGFVWLVPLGAIGMCLIFAKTTIDYQMNELKCLGVRGVTTLL